MKIFIVHYDYSLDWDADHETLGVYENNKDAEARLKKEADKIRGEWEDDEIVEDNSKCFKAHWKEAYNQNHAVIWIEEIELQKSFTP